MSSTTQVYDCLRKYVMDGTLDLDTSPIKVALVTSGYTFSAAHTTFSSVSGNEVAAGAGYTAGGILLTGQAVTYTGAVGKFTANSPVWSALTKTFRYAVLYGSGTLNGVVDPLMLCVLLDNTPGNIVISGIDYTILWNAAGIITLG